MLKNGHEKDGRQKWACPQRARRAATAYYRVNHDHVLARQRAHYERNALPKLMRQSLYDHRKRLEELQSLLTEGGRNGGEIQTQE